MARPSRFSDSTLDWSPQVAPRFNRSLRSIHHARNNHCHRKSAVASATLKLRCEHTNCHRRWNRRNRTRRQACPVSNIPVVTPPGRRSRHTNRSGWIIRVLTNSRPGRVVTIIPLAASASALGSHGGSPTRTVMSAMGGRGSVRAGISVRLARRLALPNRDVDHGSARLRPSRHQLPVIVTRALDA